MMDPQQVLSMKAHLNVLKSRFESLHHELESAVLAGNDVQKDLESLQLRWNSLAVEYDRRKEEIETEYDAEIQEYRKQIKLSEEMLEKKKEERKALLDYVHESHISEKIPDDFRNFDWESLHKMVLGHRRSDHIDRQKQKSEELASLNKKARLGVSEMFDLVPATINDRNRLASRIQEVKAFIKDWQEAQEHQEKKIVKMKNENERLALLIKQCAFGNEPVSDYVTKSVRAKCHSFLSSGSSEERLQGLIKYRMRQQRMIKLLKHQENRLAQETSRLQIAADQTSDLMMYYLNILDSKKASTLHPTNQQVSFGHELSRAHQIEV